MGSNVSVKGGGGGVTCLGLFECWVLDAFGFTFFVRFLFFFLVVCDVFLFLFFGCG